MGFLPKALTAFVGLLLLAAAIFLVPQHLQTQAIAPPLPTADQLRESLSVENGPVAIRYLTTSSQQTTSQTLGHSIFLIEWADGKLFMLDAGMDRAAAADFADLMRLAMGAGDDEIYGSVSELLGEDIRRVAGVGFTHLHIDHTQGVVPFCEARGAGARRYQTRWQAEEHNVNTEEGAGILENSCLTRGELNPGTILTSADFPGLGIVALGGHTPGSTAFALASEGKLWVFSGDTTNNKADLLENRGKPFIYSYLLVPENTGRTQELRRWFAALDAEADMTVVVSHDLEDIRTSGLAQY